jgi:hypothetical protein
VGKFFGGRWFSLGGCIDGNKFVCLDRLYHHIQNGNCLIYSFGISDDWTFEEAMANLGCTVRTFDPTIDGSKKPITEKVCSEKPVLMNLFLAKYLCNIFFFADFFS